DPATTMGPLSYAAHRDDVLGHVERARKEGATVIAGGGRPAAAALEYGCYVEPTLISVAPEQSLWRDEVFGPVLAITTATGFRDSGSPFKEQGSPGLRFYTRIKTAAVRFAW